MVHLHREHSPSYFDCASHQKRRSRSWSKKISYYASLNEFIRLLLAFMCLETVFLTINTTNTIDRIAIGEAKPLMKAAQPSARTWSVGFDTGRKLAVGPTLDVLSIGSLTRPNYLKAQLNSWASHVSIRSFLGATELDDFDQTCARMTLDETTEYLELCKENPSFGPLAKAFASQHYGHTEGYTAEEFVERNDPGWLCAQRRLGQALGVYKHQLIASKQKLADYLVVVDDDTFFNGDIFLDHVAGIDPSAARVYAGCMFKANSLHNISWDFPYGGFGTVFSKGAVERMLVPIRCRGAVSSFEENFCAVLRENQIGEQDFFVEGMSIIDLFREYSAHSSNFCLHSDWLTGYIVSKYRELIPKVDEKGDISSIQPILTWPKQCGNHSLANKCNSSVSMFCHLQTPKTMEAFTADMRWKNPERYHGTILITIIHFISSILVAPFRVWINVRKSFVPASTLVENSEETAWLERLKNDTILQKPYETRDESTVWQSAARWITPRQILPEAFENNELAYIFDRLKNGKILNATSATKGSQLKLLLELEGGQQVIFKPKRRHGGWDQHHGEIAAFHLSRLLNFRRAPISVGRRLDIENEILPVASPEFRTTFVNDTTRGKKNCFYGTCKYCRPESKVCPDRSNRVEGVMILMLPKKLQEGSELSLKRMSSPFSLQLHDDEHNVTTEIFQLKEYCRVVENEITQSRLLDIVETSILDFLIQNTDRHSYEYIDRPENDGAVLLIDQGKSFRSSSHDDMKLLVALTRCCTMRRTTYEHLQWISRWDQTLSEALIQLTSVDIATFPGEQNGTTKAILREDHLAALDRRMVTVLHAVRSCLVERNAADVLVPA